MSNFFATIKLYLPIIIRAIGFILIIDAVIEMFTGNSVAGTIIGSILAFVFIFVLPREWIISILAILISIVRLIINFDSYFLWMIIIGIACYVISFAPTIYLALKNK